MAIGNLVTLDTVQILFVTSICRINGHWLAIKNTPAAFTDLAFAIDSR